MAITIISRGTLPSEKVYTTTCRSCNSVLEFKASDGRQFDNQIDGPAIEITCPVCNRRVWTYTSNAWQG